MGTVQTAREGGWKCLQSMPRKAAIAASARASDGAHTVGTYMKHAHRSGWPDHGSEGWGFESLRAHNQQRCLRHESAMAWSGSGFELAHQGAYLRLQIRERLDDPPDLLHVDLEVPVNQNVPHGDDLCPGNALGPAASLLGQRPSGLAEDLKVVNDPGLGQLIGSERLPARRVSADTRERLQDVGQAIPISPHRGTTSTEMRSRSLVPTSTGRPSRRSRSSFMAARSRRLCPGAMSTSRSMSLAASASPLATEPKTRTLLAPCFRATARICRLRLLSSAIVRGPDPERNHSMGYPSASARRASSGALTRRRPASILATAVRSTPRRWASSSWVTPARFRAEATRRPRWGFCSMMCESSTSSEAPGHLVGPVAWSGAGVSPQRLTGRTPLGLPSREHSVQAGLTTDQKAGGSSPSGRTTCGNAI